MADDIDAVCKRMVADANSQFEKYEKEKEKASKGVKPLSIRLFVSRNKASVLRTPEEQAEQVLRGPSVSKTCNSSHMTDSARHVAPLVNGKFDGAWETIKKSKEDHKKFVQVYSDAMKKQDLRNAAHGTDWPPGWDLWHMELKDSRLSDNDPRVQKCIEYYAKETREKGRKKNEAFEKNPAAKKFLEAYDKAQK